MTVLQLNSVTKEFGSTTALDGVELAVEPGEFVTLLGPSGCGKTTLLRIVAGFERPTSGSVRLQGQDITALPPHRRAVNTVFQRYVLFPHLTVAQNVAFGLRYDGVSRAQQAERVGEALELVRLADYGPRRVDQLSGGQAQRISLARALVKRPKLLLLDEPLSALDLKIRVDMQAELRRIHRATGTTFVYVTHDQQEAMSMSDRVVVMCDGRVEQDGPPADIYHRPATQFVARFVGDANVLPVRIVGTDGPYALARVDGTTVDLRVSGSASNGAGQLVLRPEHMSLHDSDGPGMNGTVADIAFRGSCISYTVDVAGTTIRVEELGRNVRPRFEIGDAVSVEHDPAGCLLLAH